MHLLKASKLSNLQPGVNGKTGAPATKLYSDGGNLFLQVTATGAKSWLYIYRDTASKRRWMGLGSLTGAGTGIAVSLADARDLAAAARDAIKMATLFPQSGVVLPIEAKRANKMSPATFAEMVALYIKLTERKWKVKAGVCATALDIESKLYFHAAKLIGVRANEKKGIKAVASVRVASITPADVIAVLEPIWSKDVGERVRFILEQVFQTAIGNDHYKGANPALLETVESKLGSAHEGTGKNQNALPFARLPGVIQQLLDDARMASIASVFCTLTATRSDETRLMQWSEIDGNLWTVPAWRMKVKVKKDQAGEHLVPLSDEAMAILAKLKASRDLSNPYVFAGKVKGQPVGEGQLNAMLAKSPAEGGFLGLKGEATQHGMRATFSTWANQRAKKLGFEENDIERCLAHVVGTKVGRVYNKADRLDERREIMQAWGQACMESNVVEGGFRRAA